MTLSQAQSSLVSFLASLSSQNSDQVWVKWEDSAIIEWQQYPDHIQVEGAGKEWFAIGSFAELSFGDQSRCDAMEALIQECSCSPGISKFLINDHPVMVNQAGIYQVWERGDIPEGDFLEWIEAQLDRLCSQVAEEEAWFFVLHKVPEIIADIQADVAEHEHDLMVAEAEIAAFSSLPF